MYPDICGQNNFNKIVEHVALVEVTMSVLVCNGSGQESLIVWAKIVRISSGDCCIT